MALGQLDVLLREPGVGGDLGRRGRAVEPLGQALDALVDRAVRLPHVARHPDRAAVVGDGSPDGLADPPRGVGRELEALGVVELLDRPHQAEVALLDEVEHGQAARLVLAGHRHDEPEVGLDEAAACVGGVADRALQLAAAPRRGVGDLQLGFRGAAVGEQLAELDLVGRGQERERSRSRRGTGAAACRLSDFPLRIDRPRAGKVVGGRARDADPHLGSAPHWGRWGLLATVPERRRSPSPVVVTTAGHPRGAPDDRRRQPTGAAGWDQPGQGARTRRWARHPSPVSATGRPRSPQREWDADVDEGLAHRRHGQPAAEAGDYLTFEIGPRVDPVRPGHRRAHPGLLQRVPAPGEPPRAAPSGARSAGGQFQCAYHGWRFDDGGTLNVGVLRGGLPAGQPVRQAQPRRDPVRHVGRVRVDQHGRGLREPARVPRTRSPTSSTATRWSA